MQIKTNHIEPRMEQAYFNMAWHNLDKSGTPFVIVLIVVHRPEIMEIGVFKYGMWLFHVTVWPTCQIPLHCLWGIYCGFWIVAVQWDDIDRF